MKQSKKENNKIFAQVVISYLPWILWVVGVICFLLLCTSISLCVLFYLSCGLKAPVPKQLFILEYLVLYTNPTGILFLFSF